MKITTPESESAAAPTPQLETVLGLRCLSIVLSYLEECEGTSLLLSQKFYWTDTILPLLRVPQESRPNNNNSNNTNNNNSNNKKEKHRHRFSGRNHTPVIKIPDALTRLERLNTRRWNKRHHHHRRRQRMGKLPTANEKTEKENIEFESGNRSSCHRNLTITALADQEWNETVSTNEESESESETSNSARETENNSSSTSTMNSPPLLRFFHHGQKNKHQRTLFKPGTTCLASYPRSGNTLLRSLLETVTGFVTASDTRPDRNLSIALAEKPPYFVGEGLAPNLEAQHQTTTAATSASASSSPNSPFLMPRKNGILLEAPPICKTHWPERIGCHSYDCHRVVLLVRNPFDATDSYWHMNLTNTHTEKVQPHVTKKHTGFYEALVRHEILRVWISFLDYYWTECSKHKVPLLLVRYEDLVLNPRDELQRILDFCCGDCNTTNANANANPTMNNRGGGDWWKRRLEKATSAGATAQAGKESSSVEEKRKTDNFGYRSSSAATNDPVEDSKTTSGVSSGSDASSTTTSTTTAIPDSSKSRGSSRNSHPSIGRSLRRGMFPERLLKAIHEFDDQPQPPRSGRNETTRGNWLECLGYHVYKQGFPNNLDRLPPIPVLDTTVSTTATANANHSLTINVQDVSLELRSRDSPYGRNMRKWRRERTANDTHPFPTI